MTHTILGGDFGNNGGKTVGWFGHDYYKTNICDWFERNVDEVFSDDDMEFEVDGRRGFAGPIAEYEDEYGASSMYGDSKAHEDIKIRALISLYRYQTKFCPEVKEFSIFTGQPISGHTQTEKDKIKNMLTGHHKFGINGEQQEIIIRRVEVAAEGSAAYFCDNLGKDAYIVDVGSGTVNAAEIRDRKHINRTSDTFNFGTDTISKSGDYISLSRGTANNLTKLKWDRKATVSVCGGIAKEFIEPFQKHFPNAKLIIPKWKQKKTITPLHPVYANAVGMFELAKRVFK